MEQRLIDMQRTFRLRHEAYQLVASLQAEYTAVLSQPKDQISMNQLNKLYRIMMKAFKRHERRLDAYDYFM